MIGAGPAGMMAARVAAEAGAAVTLYERNDRPGRKLRITGKGRCNVTNDCDTTEFLTNVPTNPRFLYAALANFSTQDTKDFFENCGVPLKTERGRRVFPVSDHAQDIVDALANRCRADGVRFVYTRVKGLTLAEGRVCGVETERGSEPASAVIIATGGRSYPLTGSTGDGYAWARAAGHTITELHPSLVPIVCEGNLCGRLQGLSLRNVAMKITRTDNGKTVYEDFGEMMFTHFGMTGPMILSASARLPDLVPGRYAAHFDLKPALDEKQLDARLISDFTKYANRDFLHGLDDLLPQKLIEPMVETTGIDQRKKINSLTREERHTVISCLKDFTVRLSGFRPIDEAIVTKGGVSVKEIDPRTMASKKCEGLYFAGEILDVDAYTGGFNLQIAFATGALAGAGAANRF